MSKERRQFIGRKSISLLLATLLALSTVTQGIKVQAATNRDGSQNIPLTTNYDSSKYENKNTSESSGLEAITLQKNALTLLEEQNKLSNASTLLTANSQLGEVTIIVELEGASLLEYTNQAQKSSTFASYFDSSMPNSILSHYEIQEEKNQMLSAQQSVFAQIQSLPKNNVSTYQTTTKTAELLYQYTTVINGFAIRCDSSLLEEIQKISGVKNAYIASRYELEEPQMGSSVDTIGASLVWDLEYQGDGMVIAVIDTGLDVSHPAFSTSPSSPTLTRNTVEDTIASGLIAPGNYLSDKIPFVYDYADRDSSVSPTPESITLYENEHGTHVAGTIGASSGEITGVAPNAQLVILKVASDYESGIPSEYILAALDDAADLQVDVVNLSLGAPAGFSSAESDTMEAIYQRMTDAGISLSVSAGNNYSSTYQNQLGGYAKTKNPDTASVGSPSTYTGSTSVASVINTTYHSSYFQYGVSSIPYTETATGTQPHFSDLATTEAASFETLSVPGYGTVADYQGLDVSGKVVVVSRGGITFNEKVVNAASGGAIAIVVKNNQPGTIAMSISDYLIPAVSITATDGVTLTNAVPNLLTPCKEESVFPNENANQPSSFSSLGVTPDLHLKPEIAAPGENIYSSVPFGEYTSMSGTSMAAPHVAGCYALLKEHLKNSPLFSSSSANKLNEVATQLLMSTAIPSQKNGVPYFPRKQGAGVVNLYHAITTKAYFSVDNSAIYNRPKLEFGDDKTQSGVFTHSFQLHSISDSSVTYTIDTTTLTERVLSLAYGNMIAEHPLDVSGFVTATITKNGIETNTITLAPYEEVTLTLTLTLSEQLKQYLRNSFINGEFVEGYVTLTPDTGVTLSIPFLGFFGDWTKSSLFEESSIYDNDLFGDGTNELYSQAPSLLLSETQYLGVNFLDEMAYTLLNNNYSPYTYASYYESILRLDPNKIAISPNGDGYMDTFYQANLSLLRNADSITTRLIAPDGAIMISSTENYLRKTLYYSSLKQMGFLTDTLNWAPQSPVNNEVYTYLVEGTLASTTKQNATQKTSVSFPITIDMEAPVAQSASLSAKDGRVYLNLTASDNQFIAGGLLGLMENNELLDILDLTPVNEANKGAVTSFCYDITDYLASQKVTLCVMLIDYAMNEADYAFTIEIPTRIVLPKENISLCKDEEFNLSAVTYCGETICQSEITYQSSDESVVSIDSFGRITTKGYGTATITASTFHGLTATCRVTVSNLVPSLTQKRYTLEPGDKIPITLQGLSATAVVSYQLLPSTIATITSQGMLTGIREGTALLTITVAQKNRMYYFVATILVTKMPTLSIVAPNTVFSVNQTGIFLPKVTGIVASYSWSSSNPSVGTIKPYTGLFVAKKSGTVTITLTATTLSGKTITATKEVKVK